MLATKLLATLVAILAFNGCYALTGCPGSPQCDPNYVADADGSSVYGGDSNSSPETKVGNDTTKADVPDPCPLEYKALINGVNKWTCNIDNECVLKLVHLNGGKYCAVQCPKFFTAKLPDQAKFVSDTELFYQVSENNPHTCILQVN